MKKNGAILLLLLLCGGLFAYDGHMAGQKDLKVIKTEFPEYNVEFAIPDETNRRHGQAVAAASLPMI